MATKHQLVIGQLEKVSWQVLEDYKDVIKNMIKGKSGIYALYHRDKLYYVGLASNLMKRLNDHLKDRHNRKWDRFSVYLTRKDEHMKELESLFLRILQPDGNKVKGKFSDSVNLRRELNAQIKNADTDKRAILMGGAAVRSRRRRKMKDTRGTIILAGLVERAIRLKAEYDGYEYKATLRKNGMIYFNGEAYVTPTAAAKAIKKRTVNGWSFWHYKDKNGEWVRLGNLRK